MCILWPFRVDNVFSMYFEFEIEFNGEKQKSKTGAHF